ncbi:uncharacterized protein LOC128492261 [Spea bombifrons]|uniref:uncharacterized protein LOC128492261 n=1 Tax=Spea bombifrons TaxID=233779 RepID=UPI00234BFAA0|nr:uncharacterized protein LOC128492261 [Spea bombifrons]
MTLTATDYTLKSVHLLLVILVTLLVILGYSYLNETSQRIKLQQEVIILERQFQSVTSDRLAMQKYLKAQLDQKASEMSKRQKIHDFQAEQQSANFMTEKNELVATISSKDRIIEDLKDQLMIEKEHFEKLQSEMQQFKNNQSRLLEKISIQSTQCMNVISMMKELCFERKRIKIGNVSNSLEKKEITTASPSTAKQIQDITMNPHSTNIYNATQQLNLTQERINNLIQNNGENKYVSTVAQFGTSADMSLSLGNRSQEIYRIFKKELQFLKRETDKTKKAEKESVQKIRETLANKDYATNALMEKIHITEKTTQKIENYETPGVEANNEVLNEQEDQMEEDTVTDKMNGAEENRSLKREIDDFHNVEDNKWVGRIEKEKSDVTMDETHGPGKNIK